MSGPAERPWQLSGVELAIFDKDGTLIEFQRMWSDWVANLATALTAAHGAPLDEVVYATMGVDRRTGRVLPHGALAATPMARLREALVEALAGAGIPGREAARLVAGAWHSPDPVTLARPVTDLAVLFASLGSHGVRIAVATSDDREPTERTLAHLGVRHLVEAVACADDGRPVKPDPAAVLWICEVLGVPPERSAVIGDAQADMAMGRAAGVARLIGVLTGAGDRATLVAAGADMVLDSVADLVPAG
ncbi:MAG: HAD family hydrolase [Chloroflexi bacterium]|nr:HAD family hydrolase [Chloroflexota bacterium]